LAGSDLIGVGNAVWKARPPSRLRGQDALSVVMKFCHARHLRPDWIHNRGGYSGRHQSLTAMTGDVGSRGHIESDTATGDVAAPGGSSNIQVNIREPTDY
jgi:hypothetical protein